MLPDPPSVPELRATTPSDRERLATPTRQSPIALAFIAWRFIRRIGIVNIGIVVLFAVTSRFSIVLWIAAMLAAIGVALYSVLSWLRFTFVVAGDELVITRGVLSVERLVIPLDRVQSVSIDQRLLHRIVGLVSAAVDTAGSSATEFEIAAIDAPTAEALRLVASDARRPGLAADHSDAAATGATPGAVTDEMFAHRTAGELVVVAVTRLPWAGLAVLAPILALGDEIGGLAGFNVNLEKLIEGGRDVGDGSSIALVGVIVGFVAVATVFVAILQIVREVVTNWELTLHRTPAGLRRTAGLLNRTSRSAALRRVQTLTTHDTPPQRWLGITTLTLKTFGDNDIGLPGSRVAEVMRLRELVFGRRGAPQLDRRISRWFVFIATRNTLLVAVAAACGLRFGLELGWWSAITLVAVPVRWLAARRQVRLRRWGIDHVSIAESCELVTKHTAETPLFKAQLVKVTQSFFERRRGLATVRVQTADGFLAVPLIRHDEAMAARDRILFAVETNRRPAF